YTEENKTKPSLTRKIESKDIGLTTEQQWVFFFKGVERGDLYITEDLITSLFKAPTRDNAPRRN
ncbi:hypothetical protein BU15DRAFT_22195, partial [Melanogaster broomeanus]